MMIVKDLVSPGAMIVSRAGDIKSLVFKTIDDEKLALIASNMPEINRATEVFGKQNSQTTSMLMSLNMIDAGPYRRLKQVLAQIERKRAALKEAAFKYQKDRVKYDILTKNILEEQDTLKQELLCIEQAELATNIADGKLYIEACLKEIGMYQEAYKEICKNYNIPEQWDENDYEEAEIEHHIKMAFTNGIRDVMMTGRLNVGTMEYFEQYGILPMVAFKFIMGYMDKIDAGTKLDEGKLPSIDTHYEFLNQMYVLFKDEFKRAMKHSGLDKVIHGDWLYRETKE